MNFLADFLARMIPRMIMWVEDMMPILLPSTIAAYIAGRYWGYRGAALRLYMITGIFFSIVIVPFLIMQFDLPVEWTTPLSSCVSVYCYKGFKWGEMVARKALGIERRARVAAENMDEQE